MNWTFILLLRLLSLGVASSRGNANILHNSEIITNFLKLQDKPGKVTAFVCWSTAHRVILSKTLNAQDIFVSIKTPKLVYQQALPTFWPAEHQTYVIDMGCEYSTNILKTANNDGLFNFPYRWLILQDDNRTTKFEKFHFYLNSRVYILTTINKTSSIKSIYKLAKSSHYDVNDVASWNGNQLLYHNNIIDCRNRSDLMGTHLNISVVNMYEDTLNHLDDMRQRNVDAITKHNYMLINHIADILNITRHFRFHRTWGIPNPNTSIYNGEIGDLQLQISEIGGTAAFFTLDRIPIIDYVGATTPTRAKFVFRAPPLSVVTNVFTLPFDTWVWYAAYAIVIIIFFVIYIITKWEWWDEEFRDKMLVDKHAVLRPTILDVAQMQIGAICQQGAEAEPKSAAGRIATFIIFLSLMFLYTSYSANIVALLQSTTSSIRTIDDLLSSRIQLGVEETPYSRYYFQKQTGNIQKELYLKKVAPPNKPDNFMPLQKGMKRLRNEFFAFHAECDTIYKVVSDTFLESEKCGLVEIEYWSIVDPWIPIKKNSTYKELIKIGFAKLMERGIQSRHFRRMYTKKPMCQNQGANFMSVSINDCYFASLSFSIGLSLAVIIFIVEKCVNRHSMKIRKFKI